MSSVKDYLHENRIIITKKHVLECKPKLVFVVRKDLTYLLSLITIRTSSESNIPLGTPFWIIKKKKQHEIWEGHHRDWNCVVLGPNGQLYTSELKYFSNHSGKWTA